MGARLSQGLTSNPFTAGACFCKIVYDAIVANPRFGETKPWPYDFNTSGSQDRCSALS